MKVDILAFGAHPDDVELGAGATIAKAVKEGKTVAVVDLTQGELGTRGSVEIRQKESAAANKILGISFRENLDLADGFFKNDRESQLKVIKAIRKYQPKIVLCNAIDDRHIDHGKGSKLVSDSCFLSGLKRIETEDENGPQQQWRPQVVYHYIQWKNIDPDFVVDVSDTIEQKMESIKAYASQIYNPNTKEPNTPISSKNFLDSVHYRAKDLGRLIGVEAAEGFTTERFVAVKSLDDLI
ncbi:MAG: bacillithiol biosynthesis deacetylase BshB1 [Flavobacteriaceae bacterium]|nr:bacillithiol biosynthesis deacetylase BshB1 [Flavobacteriaceae bacterium]